jgi:hypothetical protein
LTSIICSRISYASAENQVDANGAETSPSILLDAYLDKTKFNESDLLSLYSFDFAMWKLSIYSRSYIRDWLIVKYRNQSPRTLADILLSAKEAEDMQILGVSVGRIAEVVAPYYIT